MTGILNVQLNSFGRGGDLLGGNKILHNFFKNKYSMSNYLVTIVSETLLMNSFFLSVFIGALLTITGAVMILCLCMIKIIFFALSLMRLAPVSAVLIAMET